MGKNTKRIPKQYIDRDSGRAKQGPPGHLKPESKKHTIKKK